MKTLSVVVAACTALLLAERTGAAIIQFNFEGVVRESIPQERPPAVIKAGDLVTGRFYFDEKAVEDVAVHQGTTAFNASGFEDPNESAPLLLHAEFGINGLKYSTHYYERSNGFYSWSINSWAIDIFNSEGDGEDSVTFGIDNKWGESFTTFENRASLWGEGDFDSLSAPDFSNLDSLAQLFHSFAYESNKTFISDGDDIGRITGDILSISAVRIGADVPEPSILSLLLVGLVGLIAGRKLVRGSNF